MHPTSLRLPSSLKDRLDRAADRQREPASTVAVRLIDEGLRMADHPGVGFNDSPAHGRVAVLVGGPDVAEVIEVLQGLESTGDDRVQEAATWFGVHPSRVRAAIGYYGEFREEVDRQIALRRTEAAELRARYETERELLG